MSTFPRQIRGRLLLLILFPALLAGACGVNEPEPKPPLARFSVGCATIVDSLVAFENASENADTYLWDFGNGETSTERNPARRYTDTGNHTATLIVSNAEGERDTMTRTFTIHPPIPEEHILDIPFIAEGSRNWTWGAISEMILRHGGITISQCEILNAYFRTDCCNRPADCVVPGNLRQIELDLERLASLDSKHQFSPLTMEQIRMEIAQNRPVVAGYERVGAAHAVLIYGYNKFGEILIHDPLTGTHTSTYLNALRYGGGNDYLEWTESTFCIR